MAHTLTATIVPGFMENGAFVECGEHVQREVITVTEESVNAAETICSVRAYGRAGWTASIVGACEVRFSSGDVRRLVHTTIADPTDEYIAQCDAFIASRGSVTAE